MTAPSLLDELEGVVKFLLGEGPLDGRWFGDDPPVTASGMKRRYWWRTDLRKAHAAMAKRLEAAERDSKRLDWLESVGFATRNMSRVERPANVHCWTQDDGKWMWTAHFVGSEFTSARAAIDAATQEGEG